MVPSLARNSSVIHKVTFSHERVGRSLQEHPVCKLSFVDNKMKVAERY